MAAGLDRRVEIGRFAGCQKGLCPLRLGQRLSSTQSDPAALAAVKYSFPLQLAHQLFDGIFPAGDLQGPGHALLCTAETVPTEIIAILQIPAPIPVEGRSGAELHTMAAVETQPLLIEQVGLTALRFRVGAPGATKGAAFEKDHGADPRSIMERETLQIKNGDCLFQRAVPPK